MVTIKRKYNNINKKIMKCIQIYAKATLNSPRYNHATVETVGQALKKSQTGLSRK